MSRRGIERRAGGVTLVAISIRAFGTSLDPSVVSRELLRIHRAHHGICAENVVEAARPVGSTLHDAFSWDTEANSEAWLLHCARNLIKSVEVVHPTGERTPQFLSVQIAGG